MEKVLAYDRSIVAQETGYWCGPAATQVVLNGRGIRRTEADLARRMCRQVWRGIQPCQPSIQR